MADKIYGLLGRKLAHSYSVTLHNALGCKGYKLIEIEPDDLGEFFKKHEKIGGLNVTIPYKREVMRYLDEISAEARAIGSVNTIVGRNGRLIGYNTDACGFVYMSKRASIDLAGKKVLIFGSGGASLAVKYAAGRLNAGKVVTISRSGENNYKNIAIHKDTDIIVNATPVGMFPDVGVSAADINVFDNLSGVIDLIYNPLRTALIVEAQKKNIKTAGGLTMLAAQAKASEEIFFEKEIDDNAVENTICDLLHKKTNIVLIGMPGSGKNSVGSVLAEISGRKIIDIDKTIEKNADMAIPEIFKKYGEQGFRKMEKETISQAGLETGKIIITGGGAVLDHDNYLPMRQIGRIYEIARSTRFLARKGRPLSEGSDLDAMYANRRPYYERFRDAVADNDRTPAECAEKIWRDFCENTGH